MGRERGRKEGGRERERVREEVRVERWYMCVAGTCPVRVELGEEINQLLLISEQYVLDWLRLVWIGNEHLIMKRR